MKANFNNHAATRNAAFSLLEVLIVLILVSTLLVIASTQYQQSVLRHNRQDAIQSLHLLWQYQQRYFATHQHYSSDIGQLDWLDTPSESSAAGFFSLQKFYTLSVTPCSEVQSNTAPNCITMLASVHQKSIQNVDYECIEFRLNSNGQYSAIGKSNNVTHDTTHLCWP